MRKLLYLIIIVLLNICLFTNLKSIYAVEPEDPDAGAGGGVHIDTAFKVGEGKLGIYSYKHLNSIGGLISTILPNVFVVAGLIIFFFIVLGGFTMITNAGNPEKQKEGSQMLTGALIGFAIIFGAYWLVQLVGLILMGDANAILTPKVTSP